jgi:hypothetical protein
MQSSLARQLSGCVSQLLFFFEMRALLHLIMCFLKAQVGVFQLTACLGDSEPAMTAILCSGGSCCALVKNDLVEMWRGKEQKTGGRVGGSTCQCSSCQHRHDNGALFVCCEALAFLL